ncbi:GNAT family N-acetyltransferase [Paracoccus homiensis]|uniref:L-amino acid N-acyltransferase YncA n=1 Tax=Paracoccus homiensis TaxID=364199 RepID=A0A1I0IPJ9_9RHOB|nr:GNAT family N-acetyltransferase [Paracoccus homiensis]SET99060.1 L-amino acid N-acyltransferase YncA [Paracoccus homiensis]
MDDVQIVKLGAAELPLFKAIRLESLRRAPSAFANTEADWLSLPDAEWLSRLKNPVYAVLRGDEPVGLMGLLLQHGEKKAHRATLIMAYLRESERGGGLADKLLKELTAFALGNGIRQLELNVSDHNVHAIRFYKRHGFEQVGRIPRALIESGREVDELIMVRRLS